MTIAHVVNDLRSKIDSSLDQHRRSLDHRTHGENEGGVSGDDKEREKEEGEGEGKEEWGVYVDVLCKHQMGELDMTKDDKYVHFFRCVFVCVCV